MKKVFLFSLLMFSVFELLAQVHVRGYYRKNGTYVQPHYRSSPDGNPYNNWSYPVNTNPYTEKVAAGNPETYLDNYYNRGKSGYSSITSPSAIPTYTRPAYSDGTSFPSLNAPETTNRSSKNVPTRKAEGSGSLYTNYGPESKYMRELEKTMALIVNMHEILKENTALIANTPVILKRITGQIVNMPVISKRTMDPTVSTPATFKKGTSTKA